MDTLRQLIEQYGKDRFSSMTKYPSILTMHKIANDGRTLLPELTTPLAEGQALFSTEKIDGCNVRLVFYRGEFLIGSRDTFLHFGGDLYYSTDYDLVDSLYKLVPMAYLAAQIHESRPDELFVVYGEFFGGHLFPKARTMAKKRMASVCSMYAPFEKVKLTPSSPKISRGSPLGVRASEIVVCTTDSHS